MTREEAIEELERLLMHWDLIDDGIYDLSEHDKDAVEIALSALRPVSREQVEKVWKGDWLRDFDTGESICGNCHHVIFPKDYVNGELPHFCEFCGEAKTDEAVQMVMERMEALRDNHI